MTTRTFTFNVQAQASTALESAANALTTAGTWSGNVASASINTAVNGYRPLEGQNNSGQPVVMIDWSTRACWDATAKRIVWAGSPANSQFNNPDGTPLYPSGPSIVRYDEATDTWSATRNPFNRPTSHGFVSFDINGQTLYRLTISESGAKWVAVYNLATMSLTTEVAWPAGEGAYPALIWHSAWNRLVVLSENRMRRLTPALAWESASTVDYSSYGAACYVPAAQKILFCHGTTTAAYTIDSSGTVAAVAASPVAAICYEGSSTHGLMVPHPTEAAALLFHANGNVYKYTFATNSWGTVGTIPVGAANTLYASDKVSGTFAVTIPQHGAMNHGVIGIVGYRGASSIFYLYRPT